MKNFGQQGKVRSFPFGRGVLAMLAPALFTPLLMLAPGVLSDHPDVREMVLLPVAALMFAWPGAVVGLLLGLPTAYWLFRRGQNQLLTYAIIGAIYTVATLIIIEAQPGSNGKLLQMAPLFALIGLLNGALARVILFGWR